jgi:hypothetical protein
MAYATLNSPLPGLTVSQDGDRCCGMRGLRREHGYLDGDRREHGYLGMLGDLVFDTTPTTDYGPLVDPTSIDPISTLGPFDWTSPDFTLPLPNIVSPSITSMYPTNVGTEFTSNGDGTYTNIQTGQSVPYSIAQQITAATTGSATANLPTQSAPFSGTIVDPNTGASISTNNLTTAAQALNVAGQLVTAAGKLTAQGQALLNGGNLYNAAPITGNFSSAMSSLTSWFTESTLFVGLPNWGVLAGGAIALMVLRSLIPSGKGRRRR